MCWVLCDLLKGAVLNKCYLCGAGGNMLSTTSGDTDVSGLSWIICDQAETEGAPKESALTTLYCTKPQHL